MKRRIPLLCAAMTLAVAGTASAADIEVMTQNQYVGTDLIGLVTEPDFNAAVIAALEDRAASLPSERVKALAALIEKRNPHLVGLQEVYAFTCVDFDGDANSGCENQAIAGAFTEQLNDTLAALGGRYVAAATVINLNLPASLGLPIPGIPITYDGTTIYLGVIDRDVILARSDVPFTVTDFATLNTLDPQLCSRPAADGCNYATAAEVPLAIPGLPAPVPIRFERGFVGVDAVVGGVSYRFVNTHLETRLESFAADGSGRFIQAAQAAELLGSLGTYGAYVAPADQVISVGDFNSDPRDEVLPVPPGFPPFLGVPPYMQIVGFGFTDVWTMRPGAATGKGAPLVGFSCCQYADLSNHRSELYERVDLIFSNAKPKKVQDARLLGEVVGDKTLPKGFGLWPSDHASVAAKIQY